MPPKRLLVVEPEESARVFLRDKLQAPNLAVSTVPTGGEGLAVLQSPHPPALVVASLEMPSPSGLDLVAAAKALPKPVPVILISRTMGPAGPPGPHPGTQDAAAVLPRPVILNDLFEAIERAGNFKIEGHERRRYPRVPVHLDLTLASSAGASAGPVPLYRTTTVDISLGGLSFELRALAGTQPSSAGARPVPNVAEIGREMAITLALSETRILRHPKETPSQSLLTLRGRIAHVIRDDELDLEFVGVKFVDMTADQRTALRDFLRENQEEVRRTLVR